MHVTDPAQLKSHYGSEQPRSLPAYDSLLRLEYVGFAPRGSLTSDAVWIIYKLSYNADGTWAGTLSAKKNSIFDNRALASTIYA